MFPNFRRELLIRTMKLFDLAVLCTAFLAALAMSSDSFSWARFSQILIIRIALSNLLLFAAYLVLCAAVFSACGLYGSHRLSQWHGRLREILLAAIVTIGFLVVMRSLIHLAFATNAFLLLFWCLNVCGLAASRECIRLSLHLLRLRGRNLRNVVIIGEEPDATALAQRVGQDIGLGYRVLRIIDARETAQCPHRN
jgi:FlaA1/EpsC-like NDP-sugar epimerase